MGKQSADIVGYLPPLGETRDGRWSVTSRSTGGCEGLQARENGWERHQGGRMGGLSGARRPHPLSGAKIHDLVKEP